MTNLTELDKITWAFPSENDWNNLAEGSQLQLMWRGRNPYYLIMNAPELVGIPPSKLDATPKIWNSLKLARKQLIDALQNKSSLKRPIKAIYVSHMQLISEYVYPNTAGGLQNEDFEGNKEVVFNNLKEELARKLTAEDMIIARALSGKRIDLPKVFDVVGPQYSRGR
jgi:hypothetical protein